MGRPYFNNSIPRTGMPHFQETSTLRSARDPDVVARSHYKHQDATANLTGITHAIRQLQNHVNRLRIRAGQGQVTPPATIVFAGEYDPARTYSSGQFVIISMGSNAGTYVYVSPIPSSNHAPYAGGGYWVQCPMGLLGLWM